MSRKKQPGFSLIEVMITVAIIAILAAVAYPSYQDQIAKSRRSDGIAEINEVLQAQERFFVNNLSYTVDLTNLGFADANNQASEEGFYLISAAACGGGIAECVNISATPQGAQATQDNNNVLTLNSRGQKTGIWDR